MGHCGLVRFRHKSNLVRVRKTSCFSLKYLLYPPQIQLEMAQLGLFPEDIDLNCHWPGSLVACNSATIPSMSQYASQVIHRKLVMCPVL